MKRVTWNGGPGHLFNAENITLGPGESRDLPDELADRLLAADEHAPNPGQLVVSELADIPHESADDDAAEEAETTEGGETEPESASDAKPKSKKRGQA